MKRKDREDKREKVKNKEIIRENVRVHLKLQIQKNKSSHCDIHKSSNGAWIHNNVSYFVT